MIIDVHGHAYSDAFAPRAMGFLSGVSGDYRPFGDGTVGSLLDRMDGAGVDRAFVANIATKPSQAASILEWSLGIRNERIVPLASVHPESPSFAEEIARFREAGFPGIKLHPMYQDFSLDDARVVPFFREIERNGMFALIHAGTDIAYPGADNAAPARMRKLLDRVPGLEVIAAHFGGWQDWEAVERDLAGADCLFDTSFIRQVEPALRDRILRRHGPERIAFGSDFPWQDMKPQLEAVRGLPLGEAEIGAILSGNAAALLARHGAGEKVSGSR